MLTAHYSTLAIKSENSNECENRLTLPLLKDGDDFLDFYPSFSVTISFCYVNVNPKDFFFFLLTLNPPGACVNKTSGGHEVTCALLTHSLT